jgi:hypothetical protein
MIVLFFASGRQLWREASTRYGLPRTATARTVDVGKGIAALHLAQSAREPLKKRARSIRPRRGFHHRRRMEEYVRGAEGGGRLNREQA